MAARSPRQSAPPTAPAVSSRTRCCRRPAKAACRSHTPYTPRTFCGGAQHPHPQAARRQIPYSPRLSPWSVLPTGLFHSIMYSPGCPAPFRGVCSFSVLKSQQETSRNPVRTCDTISQEGRETEWAKKRWPSSGCRTISKRTWRSRSRRPSSRRRRAILLGMPRAFSGSLPALPPPTTYGGCGSPDPLCGCGTKSCA